ncbi:MAG: hypothetical protein ABIS51_02840 [Sphingomonas sp.]
MTKKSPAVKKANTPPVSIAVGGLNYGFKLDINGLCKLEDKLDTSFFDILEQLQKGVDIRIIRAAFFIGLTRPDDVEVSEAEASTVMTAVGLSEAAALVAAGLAGTLS